MNAKPYYAWNRREFLTHLVTVGAAGLTALHAPWAVAEPPLETSRIRIIFDETFPSLCYGPQYVAKELLHLEGFEDVTFVPYAADYNDATVLAEGDADITAGWVGDLLLGAERTGEVVVLSGMHLGCTEVFANDRVGGFSDLKGKRIALAAEDTIEQTWFSMMLAYIGLDPHQDVEWAVHPYAEWIDLLPAGKVDAVMMWPPDSTVFRDQGIGHVIMNTTTDRPWRDYYCCMVAGNRDFVITKPVATKRALRAMLKATDLCALDPQRGARAIVDLGLPFDYESAVRAFREVPYGQWREYDPLNTLRFYALRLRDVGMLRQSPDKLVADMADLRFLNELKQELKV